MENKLNPITCKNCGNTFIGNYCNICGQKVIHERFTLKSYFQELLSIFNIERGFFFTIIQLIKNPGKVIKEVLSGKTRIYFNPIKYLLLIAGIAALIVVFTKSFDNTVGFTTEIAKKYTESSNDIPPFVIKMQEFVKDYINVVMILIVPFYSLGFSLIFSRKKLYYAEHLIINTYAYGTGTLISIFATLFFEFIYISGALDMLSGLIIMLITYIYFYYKTLGKNILTTSVLSLFSMITGFLIFFIIYMILIMVIMIILKNYTNLLI